MDYSSGAYLTKKIGDEISEGETIGYIFCNDKIEGENIISKILNSYKLKDKEVQKEKMILNILK